MIIILYQLEPQNICSITFVLGFHILVIWYKQKIYLLKLLHSPNLSVQKSTIKLTHALSKIVNHLNEADHLRSKSRHNKSFKWFMIVSPFLNISSPHVLVCSSHSLTGAGVIHTLTTKVIRRILYKILKFKDKRHVST